MQETDTVHEGGQYLARQETSAGRDTANCASGNRTWRPSVRAMRKATCLLAAFCLPSTAANTQSILPCTSFPSSSPTSSARDLRVLEDSRAQQVASLKQKTGKTTGLRRALSYRSGLSSAGDGDGDLIPEARSGGRRQDWEYRARGDPNSRVYTRLQTGLYQSEIDW